MSPKHTKLDDEIMEEDDQTTGATLKALGHPSYQELEAKLNEAEEQLNSAQSEIEEQKNQVVRAHAELDNIRKRAEKDITAAHKFALERLVTDLLPVVDSIEQGLGLAVNDNPLAQKIHEGMEMTLNLLLSTLSKYSVKPVNPLNEAFNPALHQAIATEQAANVAPDTVLKVLQKGYLLNDRLIRPALVVVAKD